MNLFVKAIAPGTFVFVSLVIYQLSYAFRFFPITEGWFAVYAWLLRLGYMPYRDFSLLITPLYSLQIAVLQTVFGEDLMYLRVAGIFITSMIGLVLWGILKRFFSSWISAYAATIGTIYYQSGNAFIGYDFTQVLTLYLLLGVLFLLLAIEKSHPYQNRQSVVYSFFAGFFFCAAMLTKQSNGGIGAAIIVLGYCYGSFRLFGVRSYILCINTIFLGSAALLIPILFWLWIGGALPYFLDQIILDALGAKGGGQRIFSWIWGFFGDPSYLVRTSLVASYVVNAFFLCFAPGYVLWLLSNFGSLPISKGWGPNYLNCLQVYGRHSVKYISVALFFLGIYTAISTAQITNPSSQNAHEFTLSLLLQICLVSLWCSIPTAITIAFDLAFPLTLKTKILARSQLWRCLISIAMGVIAFIGLSLLLFSIWKKYPFINDKWISDGHLIYSFAITFSTHLYILGSLVMIGAILYSPSLKKSKILVLFFLGLGLIIGSGTSAGLSEISAFLGVAIITAFLMQISVTTPISALIPIFSSLLLCLYLFNLKLQSPYSWWSVRADNVRGLSCADSSGILKGICIDPKKYKEIMDLVGKIQESSSSKDKLYVFPHMPIFNLLSNRLPFDNAVVTWFDFTSQNLLNTLSEDLSVDPPTVLLIARLPNEVFEGHERLFNKSIPGKQREIISVIDKLSKENIIKLIYKTNIDNIELELYKKI